MLNTLQFNMSVPTPYVFMKRFLKAAQSDKKVGSASSNINQLVFCGNGILIFFILNDLKTA